MIKERKVRFPLWKREGQEKQNHGAPFRAIERGEHRSELRSDSSISIASHDSIEERLRSRFEWGDVLQGRDGVPQGRGSRIVSQDSIGERLVNFDRRCCHSSFKMSPFLPR